MTTMIRRCAFAVVAAVAMVTAGPAAAETLPLPPHLIALHSEAGTALLIGAEARNDYFPLSMHFVTQINPAFCGPASIAMILNAIGAPRPPSDRTVGLGLFDQENLFTPRTEAVKPRSEILRGGMSLDELGAVLAAHGLDVEVVHADENKP